MTNRRRPWPQRLIRKLTRQAPVRAVLTPSPLSILSAFNLLGGLGALLSGFLAVALVLTSAAVACMACQLRRQTDLLI